MKNTNLSKYTKAVVAVTFAILSLSGCVTRSAFHIDESAKRSEVFEYCKGQQWGFIKPLSKESDAPYQAVYIEFDVLDPNDPAKRSEFVALNFVLQAKVSLHANFKNRRIQILKDDQKIYDKISNYWIIRDPKRIDQLYSGNFYVFDRVPNSANEYKVRKMKYGGFFGQMLLEDPFLVKIPTYPNEETSTNQIDLVTDPMIDDVYLFDKIIVPTKSREVASGKFTVITPAYSVNGIEVPEATHIFHFDRERVLENMKRPGRCASMEQIFRFARIRGFDPISLLLTPIILDR